MANGVGAGLFLGGMAENRAIRQRTELQADELEQRREEARRKEIAAGINSTREGIETVITAAQKAKEKGSSAEQIAGLRRLIETVGSQIGVPAPGMRVPQGSEVPGAQKLVEQGLQRFDAMVGATPGPGAEGPSTEIGKLRTDLQRGFITPQEFEARVAKLNAPAAGPNTMESVRQKLAAGQELTPGERQVYDDALRADPLARFLFGTQGGPQQQPAPVTPRPTFNVPKFSTPQEVEAALEVGDVKIGDTVILNGQRVRIDP